MKTVRYRDPSTDEVHLGIVGDDQDDVYSVTKQVPHWTEPLAMWRTLRILEISFQAAHERFSRGTRLSLKELVHQHRLLCPVTCPEVWASGVTYERSRQARNEESDAEDTIYDKVYTAVRPELFFKATYQRVIPSGGLLGLRSDSQWMIPEPELTLIVSDCGDIVGWTLGNDVSSRDIEGENPLYLPQAKIFRGSCALGPVLLWNTGQEQPKRWTITMAIDRGGRRMVEGSVSLEEFRRDFRELVEYLMRDNAVFDGTALMTGTGIVPPNDFSLQSGDVVRIGVDAIGELINVVA